MEYLGVFHVVCASSFDVVFWILFFYRDVEVDWPKVIHVKSVHLIKVYHEGYCSLTDVYGQSY